MDNDVKLNFNQLKKAIRYIKDDIDEIKKTDGYSSTGNNTGTITLSGTKKFETIKIYEDTIVCPPENVTLNRFYVYFTTFASVTVTVLGEQFITSPKKTYRLEMEYVSPFMGWNVSVTERDYTGDIDVDNLILSFWNHNITKINKWYKEQMKSNDLIITGSPDFLMNPICEYLNIESLSSVVDKNTGIVTIKQLF